MPPLVKEFFPTLTVSEGKVQGKEGEKKILPFFFLLPLLSFFWRYSIFLKVNAIQEQQQKDELEQI